MKIPWRSYSRLLAKYMRPEWRKVVCLAACILLGLVLQLLAPQVLRRFLDAATSGAELGLLLRLALWFIAFSATNQAVQAVGRYLGEDIGWTATNRLRNDLVLHCLSLDLSFHQNRTSGELIERIDGDVTRLSNFFSQLLIGLGSNLLLAIGVLIMLWRESWLIGATLSLFALLVFLVLNYTRQLAQPHLAADREQAARHYGFLGEHLAGMEDIRSSGTVGYVLDRFHRRVREWMTITVRAYTYAGLMWSSTVLMFGLINAFSLAVGAVLWLRGAATIGTVYLIVNYTEILRRPIEQIRTHLQELQRASASIGRIEQVLARQSLVQDGPARLDALDVDVEFRDVSFLYQQDEPVLQQLSFCLPAGQVLGLLGRTGSGKTTLARLLLRFYDPQNGQVLLAGQPSTDSDLKSLRSRVYLVTQEVQLFQASVRDNLTFFDASIPDQRLLEVLNQVGLDDWLATLPAGLDSELTSSGRGLSAGEAQLLAFARCFLADPAVIVMDEASSRLDPATEQLVERAVDRLLAGRTAIIIAHRLATVQRADRVLILERGQVLEQGERRSLAADPDSYFSRLLTTGAKELLV